MKLLTPVPLQKAKYQIDYNSQLVVLGSCFSAHIGDKLNFFKFQTQINPFGILFHSLAIETLISKAVQKAIYTESDVFYNNEQWNCFDVHSDLSNTSKEELLQNLNIRLLETHESIKMATHLCITLGSAWVYRNVNTNVAVANCYKMPQVQFSKELLKIDEIIQSLISILEAVQTINPSVQFIFTISPVRHLKDGFVENQRSKAHLIAAVQEVSNASRFVPFVSYFQSYEIMMDELRDYRFYGTDMVHPNALAVDYIWEKFRSTWISENCYPVMEQITSIHRDLNHRAFNPQSQQHQHFLKTIGQKISYLKEQYPFMSFDAKD